MATKTETDGPKILSTNDWFGEELKGFENPVSGEIEITPKEALIFISRGSYVLHVDINSIPNPTSKIEALKNIGMMRETEKVNFADQLKRVEEKREEIGKVS